MQAAAYGKVFVSLLMPALRCMSKARLPADLQSTTVENLAEMRVSATSHLVIAAAILVACVLVTMYKIPKQISKVEAIESLDVPPGAAAASHV